MDLYIHTKTGVEVVEATANTKVDEIAATHGGAGHAVWVEGSDEPARPGATLADVGLAAGGHVHVSTCRRVTVTASYNTIEKTDTFPPAAAARAVLEWVRGPRGFDLPAEQRATHTIVACGSNTPLDLDEHIGVFVGDDCTVCIELVPTTRFEG